MTAIKARGNTFSLSFTFTDSDGTTATVSSAVCQLEWAGRLRRETATVTLTQDGDNWEATWDSSVARAGWVHFHAHATGSSGAEYTEDGRFKISANRASYQHDTLPNPTLNDYDYSVMWR